jgi:hypothetical protein
MGKARDVELADWQAALVSKRRDQIEARKNLQMALWWCVPVAVYTSLDVLFGITLNLSQLSAIWCGGALLSGLVAKRQLKELDWLKGSANVSRRKQ